MSNDQGMTNAQKTTQPDSAVSSTHRALVIGISLVIGHSSLVIHTRSSEQRRDGLSLDQFARLIEVVVNDSVRVDAQGMINCGQNLDRMDRVFRRRRSGGIGFAVERATPDSRAGNEGGVTIGPVVPAIRRIAVARGADAQPRRAA